MLAVLAAAASMNPQASFLRKRWTRPQAMDGSARQSVRHPEPGSDMLGAPTSARAEAPSPGAPARRPAGQPAVVRARQTSAAEQAALTFRLACGRVLCPVSRSIEPTQLYPG